MTFTHLPIQDLPELNQIKIDGVRYYETPDGTFISITSLLKNYTPEGILAWRESVGHEVADRVMDNAKDRGDKVHKIIEACLSNQPENDLVGNYSALAAGMFRLMIPALDKIDQIRGLEKAVYSKRLGIAGRIDCVAEYDGVLSIIDFKTASRKRDEINENYLIQATFYSIAWEERTGEKIDQIVILTVTEEGTLDVHKDDQSKYIERLEKMIAEHKNGYKLETMIPVKQMQQKIALNDEIISSLKEFFGTNLSDFLKVYRDFQPRQTFFDNKEEELKNILKRQDTIYQKIHELMQTSSLSFANSKENDLSKLTEISRRQQKFISSIKEFFSSNSKFMAAYRKKSPELYAQMEILLDEQEVIFQKLKDFA